MKKIIITGIFFCAFLVNYLAAETLTAGYKLSVKNNAEVMGMEESGRASIRGLAAFDLNPAGLSGIQGKIVSVSFTRYFTDMNLLNIKFGVNFEKMGSAALSVDYFKTPDLPLMNDTSVYDTAKFKDYIIGVGYSYKLFHRMIILGATGRYLNSTVYTFKSSAYAVSCGLDFIFIKSLPIALTLENFGNGRFDDTAFTLPATGNAAVSYIADFQNNIIIVNLDMSSYLNNFDLQYSAGCSYEYADFLKIMFGYKLNTGERSVGIGVSKFKFSLTANYSFQAVGSLYGLNLQYKI